MSTNNQIKANTSTDIKTEVEKISKLRARTFEETKARIAKIKEQFSNN